MHRAGTQRKSGGRLAAEWLIALALHADEMARGLGQDVEPGMAVAAPWEARALLQADARRRPFNVARRAGSFGSKKMAFGSAVPPASAASLTARFHASGKTLSTALARCFASRR